MYILVWLVANMVGWVQEYEQVQPTRHIHKLAWVCGVLSTGLTADMDSAM